MSTTDTRAAFEAWALTCDGNCNDQDLRKYSSGHPNHVVDGIDYINQQVERDWQVWQAAIETTKANGTAGKPELPLPKYLGDDLCGLQTFGYTADQMRAYGQQCAEAARQPAPVLQVSELAKKLNALDMAIAHSTNLTPHSKPRRLLAAIIHEICSDAALAATAAPVEQPHYRMSEKPTAWLHTLPEGKFFNGAFSDNSQIIRDKDEADSECYFHGGTLTPLFTAEWTQAGLDYVNEKADELHKKIVGSQP